MKKPRRKPTKKTWPADVRSLPPHRWHGYVSYQDAEFLIRRFYREDLKEYRSHWYPRASAGYHQWTPEKGALYDPPTAHTWTKEELVQLVDAAGRTLQELRHEWPYDHKILEKYYRNGKAHHVSLPSLRIALERFILVFQGHAPAFVDLT
jgi:hypothetical protein